MGRHKNPPRPRCTQCGQPLPNKAPSAMAVIRDNLLAALEEGPATVAEIAMRLGVHSSGMASMLKGFERRGLVQKVFPGLRGSNASPQYVWGLTNPTQK